MAHKLFFIFSAYLFLVQPQMIFFGEPTYLLRNEETRAKQLVQTYIKQWDADFTMIMILEDVDTSLAVLGKVEIEFKNLKFLN